MFVYDGNRNLYILTEKLSGCERQIAHLSGTTAKTWPPEDSQNCWTESTYHKNDTKVKLKQPYSDIAQNRKGSMHLKRQNVFVKRKQKVNKVVDNAAFHKQSLQVMDRGDTMFQIGNSELAGTI